MSLTKAIRRVDVVGAGVIGASWVSHYLSRGFDVWQRDYANGPTTFPVSYIGSNNIEGSRIGCQALSDGMNGTGNYSLSTTSVSELVSLILGAAEARVDSEDQRYGCAAEVGIP